VRIRVRDIDETTRVLTFEEPTAELNSLLDGPARDYQFLGPGAARLACYRAGQELFFNGEVRTPMIGQCARCAETFEFSLTTGLAFVLVPRSGQWAEEDFDEQGGDVNTYEGEEVDLSPIVRERVLLSLPTLPLCDVDCRGLCARCGANLNEGACGCVSGAGDPRLAVLRTVKLGR
jgi:uncharacterized protein